MNISEQVLNVLKMLESQSESKLYLVTQADKKQLVMCNDRTRLNVGSSQSECWTKTVAGCTTRYPLRYKSSVENIRSDEPRKVFVVKIFTFDYNIFISRHAYDQRRGMQDRSYPEVLKGEYSISNACKVHYNDA